MKIRERIGVAVAWMIVTIVAGVMMLRDLWLYGELRGGHIPKLTDDGEYRYCALCGLINPDARLSCREFSLHWH